MSSEDILFAPTSFTAEIEKQTRPKGYLSTHWGQIAKNPSAMFGLISLGIILFMAIIGPFISKYTYYDIHLALKNTPPCSQFWFGSDELGRDLFSRIWWGARISLFVGFSAACIDVCIGVIYGAIAGYFGGKIDTIMMRFADIVSSIPSLLLVILFLVLFSPGLFSLILALTITGWISMARLVRGHVIQTKELDYIRAAKALGASKFRILFYHLIPSASGVIITTMTFTIPTAIFSEAFLSFLGLGVQAPIASWGTMINDGISALRYYPWRFFFPAAFLSMTMLSCNLLGDALHDLMDPRLQK